MHGYETSGVWGALLFAEKKLKQYSSRGLNVLVLPCVSPWGYEHIHRWTAEAIDPNRCFTPSAPGCPEAALAMACVSEHAARSAGVLVHLDLHETTDTDNSEFSPSKHARDGIVDEKFSEIPDGFYLVANAHTPEPAWQQAIIDAVAKVTHIAPADENGEIIGDPMTGPGVVTFDGRSIGLCGSHTDARFSTTTEVYPDSPGVSPEECNLAQVAAIVAGIDAALTMSA